MNRSEGLLSLILLATSAAMSAGCCKACSSSDSGTRAAKGAAPASDDSATGTGTQENEALASSLLEEDERDTAIAQDLRSQSIASWVVELRVGGLSGDPGYRIAITGSARVSRWDSADAQGRAHDTALVAAHRVVRLFTKFEKAKFVTLPRDQPPGSPGTDPRAYTLSLARGGKTTSITRSGYAEPEFQALVRLTEETADLRDVPRTVDDCKWSLGCQLAGHCSPSGHACVAASSDDCRQTDPCKSDGLCTAQDGECVVGSSQDCEGSTGCTADGRCALSNAKCVASAAGCKASSMCGERGACGLSSGVCAATSAQGCKASTGCERDGLCSLQDGKCVAGGDADCKAAPACESEQRCVAKCGRCVRSPDEDCDAGSAEAGSGAPGAP